MEEACAAVDRAKEAPTRRTRRALRRAATTWRKAARRLTRGLERDALDPACAQTLSSALEEARLRALGVRATLPRPR